MQEVQERSDDAWRPSPGSVYPALQQLEDEGLIRSEEIDGRKLFVLTDEGRAAVAERDAEQSGALGADGAARSAAGARELGRLMREVASRVRADHAHGQRRSRWPGPREVLAGARRDLYRILADGDGRTARGTAGRRR